MRNPKFSRLMVIVSAFALTLTGCDWLFDDSSSSTNEPVTSSEPEEVTPPDMSTYSFTGVDTGEGTYEYPDNSEGDNSRTPYSTSYESEPEEEIPDHSYPEEDPFSSTSESTSSSEGEEEEITPANVRYALTDLPTGTSIADYYGVTDRSYYASLATNLASNEIAGLGFDVFPAYAIIPAREENEEDTLIPGLAFTSWTQYSVIEQTTIYSCGFMQVLDAEKEIDLLIVGADEVLDEGLNPLNTVNASNGIYVYPQEDSGDRFIIESNAFLEGFSGVYQGKYFSYKQSSAFSFKIDVKDATDNLRDYADEDLDLYDYDHREYLYKASLFKEKNGLGAYAIYGKKASEAYDKALEILDKAIELQEENGWHIALNSMVIFSEELFQTESMYLQREAIQGRIASYLRNQLVSENQYLVVSYDEEAADFNINIATDPNYVSSDEHLANGIIKTLMGMIMLAGGVSVVIASAGTLGPVGLAALSLIGTSALTYAASEVFEGIQEIYYRDDSHIVNPVKDRLKELFGDESGERIYHTVGIVTNIALSFFAPISTVLGSSFQAGQGLRSVAQTVLQVTKEVVIHAAQLAITAEVSKLVYVLTEKLALKLGVGELGAKLIGFGSALVAGILVYRGLSKARQSFRRSRAGKIETPSSREIQQARAEMSKSGDIKYGDAVKSNYRSRNYYSKSVLVRDYANNMTVELNLENPVQIQYISSSSEYMPMFYRVGPRYSNKLYAPKGTFDPSTGKIYLFAENLDDNGVETLRTIAHLVRHAYQLEHAEFNSPVEKGLREGAYEAYSEFDEDNLNAAEVDAMNYADYIIARANHAYEEWAKNPDIVNVQNNLTFQDPDTFKEAR